MMFVSHVPVSSCHRVSESPRSRAPRSRVLRLSPTSPSPHFPTPHIYHFTSLYKSPSPDTSLVHTSPIHESHVTVPVPLSVSAHRSLLIYTSTASYVTNWQPVWIMAPPFCYITQYWPFLVLFTCSWLSARLGDKSKTEGNRTL